MFLIFYFAKLCEYLLFVRKLSFIMSELLHKQNIYINKKFANNRSKSFVFFAQFD